MNRNDFLFGAQYYRAPTPECEDWEDDLKNMKAMGLRHVKFWVQWRWAQRGEDLFYFSDIDRLMDLAYQNGLRVTLNVIFDVAPKWFIDRYPESAMILSNGRTVEPVVVCFRQTGGFPGPCYNHEQGIAERMKFLAKTVERYRSHPAMHMWDVWNEPEQCGPYRAPDKETLVCFCPECCRGFKTYLKEKYGDIRELNRVWGRCYADFDEVELPKTPNAVFSDFIDFRQFHLDKMTKEADRRLQLVRSLDADHPVYLHVVPNTSGIFNALTGVDDFALAKGCDVFASTNFAQPIWSVLTLSAGCGKTCYNVECHVGAGSTGMHQRQITPAQLTKELLPQIGLGIRGFLFWQYRAELLGFEAPAWGMTKPDGSIGSVGEAAKQFITKLEPYLEQIMAAKPVRPQVAVWKSCKNEIFRFCVHEELHSFAKSIEAYVDACYNNNLSCCIADDETVKNGLDGIKLLILPSCYAADAELMRAVDAFVCNGGTVLCEAHLGGYNVDTGRHSRLVPGFGLNETWGIQEVYTTASYHLENTLKNRGAGAEQMSGDVKKALDAIGISGGKYFMIDTEWGVPLIGAERFACLEAPQAQVLGRFNGSPCLVYQRHGKGGILYCGTNPGEAAEVDRSGFEHLLLHAAAFAGVTQDPAAEECGVHIDRLSDTLMVVNNNTGHPITIRLQGEWHGVFEERDTEDGSFGLDANRAELLTVL